MRIYRVPSNVVKKNDRKLLVSSFSSSSSLSDIKLPMLEFMCRYKDVRMIYASSKKHFFFLFIFGGKNKIVISGNRNYFNLDHRS